VQPLRPKALLVLLLALGAPAAGVVADEPGGAGDRLLPGQGYPIEASVSFPAALFHWLDSLAMLNGTGLSAGKTVPAHQREFLRLFGEPTDEDREVIAAYREARGSFVMSRIERAERGEPADPSALLKAFLDSDTMGDAARKARALLPDEDFAAIRTALARFEIRYRRVWNDGAVPSKFLERVRGDELAGDLERLLLRTAAFYGVDPKQPPTPRVVLVPVPSGKGTHAQAVGSVLLLEVRPSDTLAEQASVVVHENAHFLFGRLPRARVDALARAAAESGPSGEECWERLREALPTALGQGIADRTFRPDGWSTDDPWYHRNDVDRFAKAIYPQVRTALDEGGRFDEAFVTRACEAMPDEPAVTPRSPSP
jgi:hypothetical protein